MTLTDEILSRYLQAATVLAEADQTSQAGKVAAHPPRPQDDLSSRALAAQQLLTRQAKLLIKLHTAWRRESGNVDPSLPHSHPSMRHSSGVDSGRGGVADKALLRARLDDVAATCMSAFYSYRFDLLPEHWRQIYTDTLILQSHLDTIAQAPGQTLRDERTLDSVVAQLDRALIIAGGAGALGRRWIEGTLGLLDQFYRCTFAAQRASSSSSFWPSSSLSASSLLSSRFSEEEPYGRPDIAAEHACPRREGWGIAEFEDYMHAAAAGGSGPRPIVLGGLISDWPALGGERAWASAGYLMERTIGGKRLVPVELGRSYVDAGWGQELIPFKVFLERYVLQAASSSGRDSQRHEEGKDRGGGKDEGDGTDEGKDNRGGDEGPAATPRTGYLAQHDLFQQIPSLRRDVLIPDLCWASVPSHPLDPSQDQPALDAPRLHAWLGPARTITPLHTDGYHNLLCQAVGTKYVRLYPPGAGAVLRPRGRECGVDMSNTSGVDVGVLEGWDEGGGEDEGDEQDTSDADDGQDGEDGHEHGARGARGEQDGRLEQMEHDERHEQGEYEGGAGGECEEKHGGKHGGKHEDKCEGSGRQQGQQQGRHGGRHLRRLDPLARTREALRGVEYWECILGPGDTLLIPIGWWHYVRSLSISFSVSFWWN